MKYLRESIEKQASKVARQRVGGRQEAAERVRVSFPINPATNRPYHPGAPPPPPPPRNPTSACRLSVLHELVCRLGVPGGRADYVRPGSTKWQPAVEAKYTEAALAASEVAYQSLRAREAERTKVRRCLCLVCPLPSPLRQRLCALRSSHLRASRSPQGLALPAGSGARCGARRLQLQDTSSCCHPANCCVSCMRLGPRRLRLAAATRSTSTPGERARGAKAAVARAGGRESSSSAAPVVADAGGWRGGGRRG